ncbi:hypothetical protein J6590_029636 [Homalodisca vitripennis]|nr:hypothetical protein J6590_029636 [Homalodisca vitripennis]
MLKIEERQNYLRIEVHPAGRTQLRRAPEKDIPRQVPPRRHEAGAPVELSEKSCISTACILAYTDDIERKLEQCLSK